MRSAIPLAFRVLAFGLSMGLVGGAVGCSPGSESPAPAPQAAASEGEPATAEPALPTPRRGETIVRFDDGRVTLVGQAAPRTVMLSKLAEASGFALELGRGVDPEPIDLALRAATVEQALVALLPAQAFAVFYEVDPARGVTTLARVRVGAQPQRVEAAQRALDRELAAGEAQAEDAGAPSEAAAPSPGSQEILESLATPDAAIRAEVVAGLEPEGDAVPVLADLVVSDADPSVRAAAAQRLGEAELFTGTRALVAALADPDPLVVVAALEALQFAGDESLIPELEPLREHASADVRTAAVETIDFLR